MLVDIFPDIPRELLERTLAAVSGDVERAAAALATASAECEYKYSREREPGACGELDGGADGYFEEEEETDEGDDDERTYDDEEHQSSREAPTPPPTTPPPNTSPPCLQTPPELRYQRSQADTIRAQFEYRSDGWFSFIISALPQNTVALLQGCASCWCFVRVLSATLFQSPSFIACFPLVCSL